eukprot:m.80886 g.80886  ORF g.80886 m.80886 type:complete len:300 (+) comp8064_c0_seq1:706-1605(+)
MADSVLALKKQIESILKENSQDDNQLLLVIRKLGEEKIDKDLLQSTKIGMVVNSARKSSKNPDVQTAAKELIAKWMAIADKGTPAKPATPAAPSAPAPVKKQNSTASSASNTPSRRPSESGGVVSTREACLDTLATAMKQFAKKEDDVTTLARATEELLYSKYLGEADPDEAAVNPSLAPKLKMYRDHVRRVCSVFRNAGATEFRAKLFSHELTVEEFVNIKPEELMTEDQRTAKMKALKELMDERRLTTSKGTFTRSLQCGKCKAFNAEYTQAQTRSADEPMTTFVFCLSCGNRWKFS